MSRRAVELAWGRPDRAENGPEWGRWEWIGHTTAQRPAIGASSDWGWAVGTDVEMVRVVERWVEFANGGAVRWGGAGV
ncbi:MAG: hypothetical protein AAF236_07205 [Verrucomicrobiota bacterium]